MGYVIKGIPASEGIAIGNVRLLNGRNPVRAEIKEQPDRRNTDTDSELARFYKAVEDSKCQLREIEDRIRKQAGESHAAIIKFQIMTLQDSEFLGPIEEAIRGGYTAKAAAEKTLDEYAVAFASMNDAYLRERTADIKDIESRLSANIDCHDLGLNQAGEAGIMVANNITPSEAAALDARYIKAIVIETGSKTSHFSILARALGIPAVVAAKGAVESAKDAKSCIVDGSEGIIVFDPAPNEFERYEKQIDASVRAKKEFEKQKELHAETSCGKIRVALAANIGMPQECKYAKMQGCEGVGLFRTEFILLEAQKIPDEEEQFSAYRMAVMSVAPMPVVFRTFDMGGDKEIPFLKLPKEANPFLGYRAIRVCLDRKNFFKTQLRAILRAGCFGKALLMFPMISGYDELTRAKCIFEEAKRELESEEIPFDKHMEVGIMIEIPAAAVMSDVLAKEVDFFSIGTNDLVQYTLAADRTNERVTGLYDYFHPSVLRLIRQTAKAAHENGIRIGMCGEMASDLLAAPVLLGLGLDELSMNASAIPRIKGTIRKLTKKTVEEATEKAMTAKTPAEVRRILKKYAQ